MSFSFFIYYHALPYHRYDEYLLREQLVPCCYGSIYESAKREVNNPVPEVSSASNYFRNTWHLHIDAIISNVVYGGVDLHQDQDSRSSPGKST